MHIDQALYMPTNDACEYSNVLSSILIARGVDLIRRRFWQSTTCPTGVVRYHISHHAVKVKFSIVYRSSELLKMLFNDTFLCVITLW